MKALHCDAKTCQDLIEKDPRTIDFNGKRYDLCKTCFDIFTKWIAENLIGGENIPPTYYSPIETSGDKFASLPYWYSPPVITWTYTNVPNTTDPVPIYMGNLSLKGNSND